MEIFQYGLIGLVAGVCAGIFKPLTQINKKSPAQVSVPSNPNSSPKTEKTKIRMSIGQMRNFYS